MTADDHGFDSYWELPAQRAEALAAFTRWLDNAAADGPGWCGTYHQGMFINFAVGPESAVP